MARLLEVSEQLKWKWESPFRFLTPDGHSIDMVRHEEGYFLHAAREQIRKYTWATDHQAQSRDDMRGLGRTVAYEATTALLRARHAKPRKPLKKPGAGTVAPVPPASLPSDGAALARSHLVCAA